MNLKTANLFKRHPLVVFFVLAYTIAWLPAAYCLVTGNDSILGISFVAPAIAAVILTIVNQGKTGLQALISRLFLWRVNLKAYGIALLAPVVLEVLAILTHRLVGESSPAFVLADWVQGLPGQIPSLLLLLFFLTFLSAGEELGWRGYALPGLQARYGGIWASLILGTLWGLWHLPMFWIAGTTQYGLPVPGYVLAAIGYTFIYMCIYNISKGSVLLVSLYHAASNLTLTYGNVLFPKVIQDLYLSLPALALLVLLVMLLSGSSVIVRKPPLAYRESA